MMNGTPGGILSVGNGAVRYGCCCMRVGGQWTGVSGQLLLDAGGIVGDMGLNYTESLENMEGRNATDLKYWSTQICDAIRKQVGQNGG